MSNLPQIIFSGINLSAMSRDELKAFVVGLDSRAPGADALIQMAFRLDAKLAEAERGIDAWEAQALQHESANEKLLWREALLDEGLADWEIDLIDAGQPVPNRGREWQPIAWLEAQEGRPWQPQS
jgi:hypothetical protein